MKTKVINLDGGRGVLIPDQLIEQTGLSGEVEIKAEGGSLVIGPSRRPREGWDESLKEMAARGDEWNDEDGMGLSSWDEEEWEW